MTDHPMPEPAEGGEEIFESTTTDEEFTDSDEQLGDKIEGSVDDLAENNEADGGQTDADQSEHSDSEPKGEEPEPFEPPSTESIDDTLLAKDSRDLLTGKTETHPE